MLILIALALTPQDPTESLPGTPCVDQPGEEVAVLENGNFQFDGTVHTDVTYDLDFQAAAAAFWNGAEGRIESGGSNNRLALLPTDEVPARELFAYQRVGVPADLSNTARLVKGWVRIADPDDEAWISLTEGDRPYYALRDFLQAPGLIQAQGGPVYNAQWNFYEDVGAGEALMDVNGDTASSFDPLNKNKVKSTFALFEQGSMILEFQAQEEGWVRILVRPHKTSVDSNSFYHEVLAEDLGAPGTFDLVDSVTVASNDLDGPVVAVRTYVEQDQKIRLKATLLGVNPDDVTTRLEWRPVIAYEGRTLVYRFTRQATPPPPPARPNHEFFDIQVPGQQWYSIKTSWPNGLCIGHDFEQAFGELPRPPLDLVLTAPVDNTDTVRFNGLDLTVKYATDTEEALRMAIFDEAILAQEDYRLVNDREGDAAVVGEMPKIGSLESPYLVHPMTVVGGPADGEVVAMDDTNLLFPCLPVKSTQAKDFGMFFGIAPPSALPFLERFYDDQLFEDHAWITEQDARRRHPVTGIPNQLYDAKADVFVDMADLTPPIELTNLGAVRQWLRNYELTNDLGYLQVAFDLCSVAAQNGVIPFVDCGATPVEDNIDCISTNRYRIDDGTLDPKPCPNPATPSKEFDPFALDFHDRLIMPGVMIQVYAACRAYNDAAGFEHFDVTGPGSLEDWVAPIEAAVVKTELRHKPLDPTPDADCDGKDWGGSWQNIGSAMNDQWGNQGEDGHRAWLAAHAATWLASVPELQHIVLGDGMGAHLQDLLMPECDIVFSGAVSNLPLWFESVARGSRSDGGDESRCWPSFNHVRRELEIQIPNSLMIADIRDQLYRASMHTTRFQVTGFDGSTEVYGLWCSSIQQDFHYKDRSRRDTNRAPSEFLSGLAEGLEAMEESNDSVRKADLVAVANEMLAVTAAAFRKPFGYAPSADDLDAVDVPPDDPVCFRQETRFLEGMLEIADQLDGVHQPPSVSIPIRDLMSTPQGTVAVPIVINAPEATTTQEMLDVLRNRFKLAIWQASPGCPTMDLSDPDCELPDAWDVQTLWDGRDVQGDDFTITVTTFTPPTVVLTITDGVDASLGEFKLRARIWDTEQHWDADTVIQDW